LVAADMSHIAPSLSKASSSKDSALLPFPSSQEAAVLGNLLSLLLGREKAIFTFLRPQTDPCILPGRCTPVRINSRVPALLMAISITRAWKSRVEARRECCARGGESRYWEIYWRLKARRGGRGSLNIPPKRPLGESWLPHTTPYTLFYQLWALVVESLCLRPEREKKY
jgi:hypothetical protein